MDIDYFCFSVPSLDTDDYTIKEEDDENLIWIKSKEKELMNTAKENGLLVVFDRSTKKFYIDYEEVDLKGKKIFPRSFIPYEKELLSYLEQSGAESIQTNQDLEEIINWPQKIQPLHRRVIPMTYREFQQNSGTYKTDFQKVFFKTAKKSHTHYVLKFFGYVEVCGNKLFATKPPLWDISLDDEIFISDAFKSIDDPDNNMDCKEYRVFVLNDTLLSISRSYIDYPTAVPDEVKTFVEEQIERTALVPDFPSSYVLDVGQMLVDGREVIDIIEYNTLCAAGLEVGNLLVAELLKRKQSVARFTKRPTDYK